MMLADIQRSPVQVKHASLSGGRRLKGILAESSTGQPLVTVVTAVYNGQPSVVGCLESVLRQDYPNIEHIVLDGGSSDGTVDVLRQYEDSIALWRSEPDEGVYDAWNKALVEARGEWICFLGVDDEFLPGAISAYMALAAKNPQAEYLSSKVRWVHSSGFEKIIGRPWTWREFSQWSCTAHVGSMHRCSLYDRLGTYDTSYRIAADYELLLRARGHLRTAYMPLATVIMRAGGLSDHRAAFFEQARAKVAAGGRNKLLVALELYGKIAKSMLRPIRYALARTLTRIRHT